MPRLVSAILARNEGAPERYFRRVLKRCAEFSDATLVLDDHSTDDTTQIAREIGAVVVARTGETAWGQEAPARAELWEHATRLADGGWVLICDADMLLQGDVKSLCHSWEVTGWAFVLADLWDSETTFRVDGPWSAGPITPRPWLFNLGAVGADFAPTWSMRGVHCGHFPQNWPGPIGVAPPDIFWKHLAYVKPEHRKAKHAQYTRCRDQLTPFEIAHAESILDHRIG